MEQAGLKNQIGIWNGRFDERLRSELLLKLSVAGEQVVNAKMRYFSSTPSTRIPPMASRFGRLSNAKITQDNAKNAPDKPSRKQIGPALLDDTRWLRCPIRWKIWRADTRYWLQCVIRLPIKAGTHLSRRGRLKSSFERNTSLMFIALSDVHMLARVH